MDNQREVQRLTQENQSLKRENDQLKNIIKTHDSTNRDLKAQLGKMAHANLHLSQKANTPTCKKCSGRC